MRVVVVNVDVIEKKYKIMVLFGDGIGLEIIGVVVDVLWFVGF